MSMMYDCSVASKLLALFFTENKKSFTTTITTTYNA